MPAPPADIFRQMGFSGTPTQRSIQGDAVVYPDEYVAELMDPVARMTVFEEMRNSDDAVNTAIQTRESLITQANWAIAAPDDTPAAREMVEFCEDNIYPILDRLLQQLGGGAIQYGMGLVEPTYMWADRPRNRTTTRGKVQRTVGGYGRKIFLDRVLHIRQKTVHTFVVDERGELLALRQWANTADGYRQIEVPARKLLVHTYNQQGDDYWGLPPTRQCYKAWTFKNQLERLNLLGLDRFGVGTPTVEAGEGWQDADFKRMQEALRLWRSGTDTYLVYPKGGSIAIVGGDGALYMSILEWVRFYTLAISLNYLTQGTQLSLNSEAGARSLGDVMYEQTAGVAQADCEALASLINERLIVPLIDWNFGEQEAYPTFQPSQRVQASSTIATVIQGLVEKKIIHWRDGDEMWLRDKLKLPDITVEDIEDLDAEAADQALLTAAAMAGAGEPEPPGGGPPQRRLPPPPQQRALPRGPKAELSQRLQRGTDWTRVRHVADPVSGRALAVTLPAAATPDKPHRTREYTEWEESIVRPRILTADLDLQTASAAAEVRRVLAQARDSLAQEVARICEDGGATALSTGAERIRVPARLRTKLRRALILAAERARLYGANAVTSEIARQADEESAQRAPSMELSLWQRLRQHMNLRKRVRELDALADIQAAVVDEDGRADPNSKRDDIARYLIILTAVGAAVADELARLEAAVRGAALAVLANYPTASADDLATRASAAARSAMDDLSVARTEDNLRGVVNVGWGEGRRDGLDRHLAAEPDSISAKYYSAVLDFATCEECAKWDGAEFPIDYPEDRTGVRAPNPRCYGSLKRCRCIWVYKAAGEEAATIPATRGPLV